ncbi:MAG TPA: isoprenylcysteine carboxylmethyltransferase family protein [Casimicrobiaceae bacterium]|jgi:protein-S-isoprenylcysteine O-methyltransferase Ste14|nr:isoprenylcysteine carboxylmethyltransferase family protein [Casimicrobiaceae bacterium]
MKDLPGVLLTATIWTYWFGVGLMIVRARRATRRLAGFVPQQPVEQLMWIVWLPLVAAWIVLPYLALVRSHGLAAEPAFARGDPGYATLRWIAAICGIGCLLLTSVCWSRMGRHWRMAVVRDGEEELITDGPFRHVRHPIYALSMLLMVCSALVVPTLPMLGVAIIHLVLMHFKARNEERHLLAVHGAAYRGYLARTGRFFPRRG